MNLNEYLANKCLKVASVELAKQAILEDKTLSSSTKQNWISILNTMSTANDMVEICKIAIEMLGSNK